MHRDNLMSSLLSVRSLEVRYGDLVGIADVSLDVTEGSVVGLGPTSLSGGSAGSELRSLMAVNGVPSVPMPRT